MVEQIWDGVTRRATLSPWAADARARLADSARRYDWAEVFAAVDRDPELVNSTRPDGRSWYAPLHQAAHGGASTETAGRLIARGAWRRLRDAAGERPVDIATRRGHHHLLDVLLDLDRMRMWFPVPGMYGGFSYHLETRDGPVRLVVDSWCRIVGGSEQRHEITSEKTTPLDFPGLDGNEDGAVDRA
ncbi:ankyrin repeat domain-containing protein [Micromonospora sp. WMMD882]|uniref:ankyrin repeat domain-containing protein n=1 Tax=Micromonospora sp. WMMD882 TaxID=3015151 RepID=UPI00248B69F9|nr:ankyrin repeat domain-containing protein [Micromonospora sp. WMMD882]WBB80304.1 ankyrin repeat domain-containing protein [Micromonospora sp. WMMD882]